MNLARSNDRTGLLKAAGALLALAIVTTGCASVRDLRRSTSQEMSGTTYEREAEIDGHERRWQFYVPPAAGSDPRPLLIALHGGGGTGDYMESVGGFNALADQQGFVTAFPDALNRNWNDGRDSDFSPSHRDNIDDVGFLSKMIDSIAGETQIDMARVYATGISNGAMMSLRLACDLASRIAAVAPVAGSMPTDQMPRCRPSRPVSVLMINGTDDPLVPYDGGVVAPQFGERGTVEPVSDTIGFWRAANSCTQGPAVERLPDGPEDDGSSVVTFSWSGCADSAAVELYRIDGGGHTWPNGPQYLPVRRVGQTNRDFDATEHIWEFFTAHSMARIPQSV
ncbi:MAG: esterase [Acidobacteria bacterium]|nr:MAG: esterase [Acidobacteriota bacterium]